MSTFSDYLAINCISKDNVVYLWPVFKNCNFKDIATN